MSNLTIAIDGPSGAGKSSSAKALAERLKISRLDTGAMYRALAVAMLKDQLDLEDAESVTANLPQYKLSVHFRDGQQVNLVNGRDFGSELYTSVASMGASNVSKHSAVRAYLVNLQRELAGRESFVLEGRDIGTVVLPKADAKFFLTAAPEVRARRRWLERQARGEELSYEQVLADLNRRDVQDSSRADSPLKAAADAYLIDSSNLSFEEVIVRMLARLREAELIS